jgi:hypothetical protein
MDSDCGLIMLVKRTRLASAVGAVLLSLVMAAPMSAPVMAQSNDDAAAAQPLPEDRGSIDPFADELITRVASYLTSITRFTVSAEVSSEQLLDSGHKIALSRSVTIRVRRPDRLRADIVTDGGEIRFLYDGETLSMHDLASNSFAVAEVADNIDDMVDQVKGRFDINMPLVDLLVSDVRDNYARNVTSATYVGLHQIAGVRHHHLLLSNDNIDYQLWIADGADPLPRKLVITQVARFGLPQQTVTITNWDFQPQVPDVVFEFNPPADADELEFQDRSGESK